MAAGELTREEIGRARVVDFGLVTWGDLADEPTQPGDGDMHGTQVRLTAARRTGRDRRAGHARRGPHTGCARRAHFAAERRGFRIMMSSASLIGFDRSRARSSASGARRPIFSSAFKAAMATVLAPS
ncbi:hypothetical protein SAMN02745121_05658 [Nannocystis exedens]|uniref:Uncharacterized protein n=1 Tax=Nannocystis exedens TaxID=54 RepID=A0A1I2DPH9_9BACT|nr:hypothetical protein NAEX_02031 [Nannocystis exedens]SFE82339.1 hypothetical protein SAMN02745121_05658 [Nannocystis exedens]